jgi:MoaA/NifB/PqqE/SkfB family radical SAM enzyme
MDEDLIKKVSVQIKEFPQKIKRVNFSGFGEPLTNKNLPRMIKTVKLSGVVETISLITNGTLFNKDFSDEIVDAGIDIIKISLQGISSSDYYKHSESNIDFDKMITNLKYLYNISRHKKNIKIYVKIPDSYLTKETEKYFYEKFDGICDFMSTERLGKIFKLDYNRLSFSPDKNRYSMADLQTQKICPTMFYHIGILFNGDISIDSFCCRSNAVLLERYNIREHTLYQIWNSDERKENLLKNLQGDYTKQLKKCETCILKTSFAFPEDSLDNYQDKIYQRLLSAKNQKDINHGTN